MNKYIKTWLLIAVVVDVVAFLHLFCSAGTIIRCNRGYEKVYPCNTNPHVVASIDEFDGSYEFDDDWEPEEPYLRPVTSGNDFPIIMEMIVGIDLILAGVAILLYFVLSYWEDRRPFVSSCVSLLLVLFVYGSAFAFYEAFKFVSEPGGIVHEYYYNAPIIYLYDEQEREATVKLDLNGDLTCTYPRYDQENGWTVKTSADGVLTDAKGRQYEYLFWEGNVDMDADLSKGFCVRGEDTAAFLEEALSELGLSDTEADTFIMYWLPQMESNPYNVIAFQTENYEEAAKLDVDPLPDTVVRVSMIYYASDEYVKMEEQDLSEMNPALSEREGFVLVEWGGAKLG